MVIPKREQGMETSLVVNKDTFQRSLVSPPLIRIGIVRVSKQTTQNRANNDGDIDSKWHYGESSSLVLFVVSNKLSHHGSHNTNVTVQGTGTNSSQGSRPYVCGKAKRRVEIAVPIKPQIKMGLRPYLSLKVPQTTPVRAWPRAKEDMTIVPRAEISEGSV